MKQFKNFIPFRIDGSLRAWLRVASKHANQENVATKLDAHNLYTKDPSGSDWSSIGLVDSHKGLNTIHDLDGAACLLVYQINERVLPCSVRDEELSKRVADLVEREGRPINKKEYAELRDDVEIALLPKAFIRRSFVPVFVYDDLLLVCTSSAKKCDDVLFQLARLTAVKNTITFAPAYVQTVNSLSFFMHTCAVDGSVDFDDDESFFASTTAMKLKGEDKRVIAIKDRNIGSVEVQALLKDVTYAATELRMTQYIAPDTDPCLEFTLTEKGIFKSIKLGDISLSTIQNDHDDTHALAWLHAKTYQRLFESVVAACDGEHEQEGGDDDEL